MANLPQRLRNQSAHPRHDGGCNFTTFLGGERSYRRRTERLLATTALCQPCSGSIDHIECVFVARQRCLAPREQSMRFEHDAARLRIVANELTQTQAEFIAGTDPGKPA